MIQEIHFIIQESVSSGFWKFMGYWAMLFLIIEVPCKALIIIAAIIINKNKK